MRQLRSIVLDPLTPDAPEEEFRTVTEREGGGFHTTESRWREDSTLHIETKTSCTNTGTHGLVTVEEASKVSMPCFIEYDDVFEATLVSQDEGMTAPWVENDGWDHSREMFTEWCHKCNVGYSRTTSDQFQECQGYAHSDGETFRVHIKDCDHAQDNKAGFFQHMRYNGASKQVAAEMTALWERRYVAQLTQWYLNGWEWWRVHCEFVIKHDNEYESSCGGIDDYVYAQNEARHEVASEVVWSLEAVGYSVINTPAREDVTARYVYRNLKKEMQNWTE